MKWDSPQVSGLKPTQTLQVVMDRRDPKPTQVSVARARTDRREI
jgi:hypothetical protein